MSTLRLIHCTAVLASAFAIGAGGCSDPASPSPQGAFSLMLGGSTCPATDGTISVGTATSNSKSTIEDGQDNTSVSCSVSADGDTLTVRANIRNGSKVLSLEGTTSKAKPGTVTQISVGGGGLTDLISLPSGQTCTLTTVDGGAGKLWAGFKCDSLTVKGQTNSCQVTDGWLVVENCDS